MWLDSKAVNCPQKWGNFIHGQMVRSGGPVSMGGLVLVHEQKRPIGVSPLVQPLQSTVGDNPRCVARVFSQTLGCAKNRVVVEALLAGSIPHFPVVEPGRVAPQLLLSDHSRLVAPPLKEFGHRLINVK